MESLVLRKLPFAISPQKLNLVAGLVRRRSLSRALEILTFSPNKGSRLLYKMLQGAAKTLIKNGEDPSNFILLRLEVGRGIIMKRIIFRARGTSNRIHKRLSLVSCLIMRTGNPARFKGWRYTQVA